VDCGDYSFGKIMFFWRSIRFLREWHALCLMDRLLSANDEKDSNQQYKKTAKNGD